jgi:preprotein translocase subunit SecY
MYAVRGTELYAIDITSLKELNDSMHAIENINRELDFIDSYNRSLDSILTLQDLASIHRVESSINYLTIILVIGTIILIILELMTKWGIPSGGH